MAEPAITQDSTGDRIDYVYAGGPSTTTESQMVGEKGGPDVEIEVSPWGSDHRAVVSTFDVTPVAMPAMVSVNAQLQNAGDTITVAYNAPGSEENEIAIVPDGGDPASPVMQLDAPGESGTVDVETADLDPTGYEVILSESDGTEVARVPFWIRDPAVDVVLTTDKPEYEAGEPIEVSWTDGPANRWDWIGVYEASAANPLKDSYLIWAYTGLHASGTVPPSVAGSVTMGPETQGKPWPLPPGDYVVHYLLADEYQSAASAPFSVVG